MSKDKGGIEVAEYRIDWENMQPMAKLLIEKLEGLQRVHPRFDFHLKAQKERNHFLIFTNVVAGDPANAKNNVVLEYRHERVAIGTGALDRTPVFHKLRHRVESVETRLDHMLMGLMRRPDAFQYKVRTRRKPGPA